MLTADLMLRRYHWGMSLPASVFFLLFLPLIATLYDRWHPVFDERFSGRAGPAR